MSSALDKPRSGKPYTEKQFNEWVEVYALERSAIGCSMLYTLAEARWGLATYAERRAIIELGVTFLEKMIAQVGS